MSYRKRQRYGGRRSSSSFGSMVSDSAAIASKLSPKGALITGLVGFTVLYFAVPWALVALADSSKAQMTSQLAPVMGKVLDDLFVRRFIHPAELAGIAVLLVCVGIALWKTWTDRGIARDSQRDASWLARLLARILD